MAKIENPYSKIIDDINESLSLHKLEMKKARRDSLETKLEESVNKYANDPKVNEIKAQKKISEDDQGYLDINIFSSTYYKTKLDLFNELDKEYKKLDGYAIQYKELIEQRISKFELNASILSKFTPEELEKNPKLSKMMNDVPEGYENIKKKYTKCDVLVSKLFSSYIEKNSEDYADKLYEFLAESKQFRKQFTEEKQAEINQVRKAVDLEKEINKHNEENQTSVTKKNLFGDNQASYDILAEIIMHESKADSEQVAELKTYIFKVLNSEQIGRFTKFEENIFEEYSKYNSADQIIGKRLQISFYSFMKGANAVKDMLAETANLADFNKKIEDYLTKELYERDVEYTKRDPAFMNIITGYAAGLKKFIGEHNNFKQKGLFGFKSNKVNSDIENTIKIHDKLTTFLLSKVNFDPNMLNNDLLGTMITEDKKDEISYNLLNNVSTISNTTTMLDFEDGSNRLIAFCIIDMVKALNDGKDPIQVIDHMTTQYIKSNREIEHKDEKEVVIPKSTRSVVSGKEKSSAVKRILQ